MREIIMEGRKYRPWDTRHKQWTDCEITQDGSMRFLDKHIGTWFCDKDNNRFVFKRLEEEE